MALPAPSELFQAAQRVIQALGNDAAEKGLMQKTAEGFAARVPAQTANATFIHSLGEWAPALKLKTGEVFAQNSEDDVSKLFQHLGTDDPNALVNAVDKQGYTLNGQFLSEDEFNQIKSWFGEDGKDITIRTQPGVKYSKVPHSRIGALPDDFSRTFRMGENLQNAKLPDYISESMKSQGKNPARLYNDIDMADPNVKSALADDPMLKALEKIDPLMAAKARTGNVSKQEMLRAFKKAGILS